MFRLLKPIGRFILKKIIRRASPDVRAELRDFVLNTLRDKAKATSNKWDDVLVELLMIVLK